MKANVDHFFTVGSSHEREGKPCQDYAMSGYLKGMHYAIVADGCSSSEDTDIGSRLLSLFIRNYICDGGFQKQEDWKNGVKNHAASLIQFAMGTCHIPETVFDSTVIAAFVDETNKGRIFLAGDGGFALKLKDGDLYSYFLSWGCNAPPYLSYHANRHRSFRYTEMVENNSLGVITEFRNGEMLDVQEYDCRNILHQSGILIDFLVDDVESIGIFTDGVASFDAEDMSIHKSIKTFMDIKSYPGSFVKRTCLGNLRRLSKAGVQPFDDFSMGCIHLEHQQENSDTSRE